MTKKILDEESLKTCPVHSEKAKAQDAHWEEMGRRLNLIIEKNTDICACRYVKNRKNKAKDKVIVEFAIENSDIPNQNGRIYPAEVMQNAFLEFKHKNENAANKLHFALLKPRGGLDKDP